MNDASFKSTSYDPENILAGGHHRTALVTLTDIGTSGALVRGTVLGMITSGEKYGLSLNASADGSEDARAILIEDNDPTGADISNVGVYIDGDFNEDKLTYGTGQTKANVKESLRAVGINLKDPVSQ